MTQQHVQQIPDASRPAGQAAGNDLLFNMPKGTDYNLSEKDRQGAEDQVNHGSVSQMSGNKNKFNEE